MFPSDTGATCCTGAAEIPAFTYNQVTHESISFLDKNGAKLMCSVDAASPQLFMHTSYVFTDLEYKKMTDSVARHLGFNCH